MKNVHTKYLKNVLNEYSAAHTNFKGTKPSKTF